MAYFIHNHAGIALNAQNTSLVAQKPTQFVRNCFPPAEADIIVRNADVWMFIVHGVRSMNKPP
jgi:hypothetical protein